MRTNWTVLWELLLCILLLGAGCGGHQKPLGSPELKAPVSPLSGLPAMPLERVSSVNQAWAKDGKDTFARSANAIDDGNSLLLNAGAQELAWGIWGFDATGVDLVSLAFDVTVPDGAEIYLALADYTAGHWEILGPFTSDQTFPLNNADHKSPADGVYCAALAFDGNAPTCVAVTLTVDDTGNQPPVASIFPDISEGEAPLAVTFDAMGSYDPDGTLEDYEWDLDGNGAYNEIAAEQAAQGMTSASFTYSAVGEHTVHVRVTDDGGLTDVADATVTVLASNEPPVADLQADPTGGGTPLLVAFDASGSYDPEGGAWDNVWDFDGDDLFNEEGVEADNENTPTASVTYYAAGTYQAAVRVTDGDGVSATASVQINVTGNQAPVADLTADVTEGDPTLNVTFSAAGSIDPDGTVEDYEWDLDGDGLFNEAGDELAAQGTAVATYSYGSAGAYYPTVRVTDNAGGTDEAALLILVHGWIIVTVDARWGYYVGTSLALVDGKPAISYAINSEDQVCYARSSTPLGLAASDWQYITLDNNSGSWTTSLQVVDGMPAIAYDCTAGDDLVYLRSTTPTGAQPSDWQPVIVDGAGETGISPSLAVVDGRPAIAYFDRDEGEMRYALSSTAGGMQATDWSSIALCAGAGYDDWASLAVIDGKPAIAYYIDNLGGLRYAYSATVDGAAVPDWTNLLLHPDDNYTGEWCSLASIAGKPAISYSIFADVGGEIFANHLGYATSSTAQGGALSDWVLVTVDDDSGAAGIGTALAEVNGKPAIAYADYGPGTLKFASSATVAGNTADDWSYETADATQFCGDECSLAVINGYPAISYFCDGIDSTELRYAILVQ